MSTRLRIHLCTIIVLLSGWSIVAEAQEISLAGGNPTIAITTGSPGVEPLPVVNTSTTLQYRRQSVISKITIKTVCPGQRFNLAALATSVTKGVAAPEVTLTNGMLDTDFITSIPRTGAVNATATIRYTASATFAQGNSTELGDDVHTVTYTILAQ